MRKARENKEYVEKELPYRLLTEMYKDSRRSLKELGRELHISYHTISRTLSQLEEKYKLAYTLDLDIKKLGFSEGLVITVKFEEKPEFEYLKQRFEKDPFVQDAYLAEGDFDLLLYIVGLTPEDLMVWQWKLRIELRKYKPLLKMSTVEAYGFGFFPLRNALIEISEKLSPSEKKILKELNENSRTKLKTLVLKSKVTQMKTIYAIQRLKQDQIIKKFTCLTQEPSKHIFLAFAINFLPDEIHKKRLIVFWNNLVKENMHAATSDYSLECDVVGAYDTVYVCTFENGEHLSAMGPDLHKALFSGELLRIEKGVLTGVLVGKWPFHLDDYEFARKRLARLENE